MRAALQKVFSDNAALVRVMLSHALCQQRLVEKRIKPLTGVKKGLSGFTKSPCNYFSNPTYESKSLKIPVRIFAQRKNAAL
jgi:hypothetical protein